MGISMHLALMSLAAGLAGNFQLGYLASVLTQPYIAIEQYINSSWIERSGEPIERGTLSLLMSVLNIANPVAAIFGQMIALSMCNRFGRKNTALIGCTFIFPGILMCLGAKQFYPYYELLFVGRLIWSVAVGILIVNQTVWLVETSPAQYRGTVSSMQEVFAALGGLVTQALGVPFSNDDLWPLMFVFPLAINVLCVIMFLFVHDSPYYLLLHEDSMTSAKRAIAAYHGTRDEDIIGAQLKACREEGASSAAITDEKKVNGMDIMFRPWKANDNVSQVLFRGAWIGVMVKIAYLFTGTRCIRSFSTYVLDDMGQWSYLDARYGSLAMSLLRVPITFIPVFLVDRIGRRPLLLGSAGTSVIFLAITMFSLSQGEDYKIGTLLGVASLLTVNSIGLGSLARFYAAELVPRKLLLKAVTLLAIIEAIFRIGLEFSFYPLAHTIGVQYFNVFLLPTLIFFFLIYWYCPETKGRSVNAVLNEMARQKGVKVTFQT
uniref:Major facilitator superfamily (MFS) profile domain-containing protein n=1 Tax=Plectus sambesii TaxID=2011161 RepID=A0A914W4X9_9BILA